MSFKRIINWFKKEFENSDKRVLASKPCGEHFIDPPEGWKYGFPKIFDFDEGNWCDINPWLIGLGYPELLIREYGKHFHVRVWKKEN